MLLPAVVTAAAGFLNFRKQKFVRNEETISSSHG